MGPYVSLSLTQRKSSYVREARISSSYSSSSVSLVNNLHSARGMSLIYIANRSTLVIDPKRSFILASHVSSENFCSLHDTTMNDAIFYCTAPTSSARSSRAQSIARFLNLCTCVSSTVFLIAAQCSQSRTSVQNEEGYRDGKL